MRRTSKKLLTLIAILLLLLIFAAAGSAEEPELHFMNENPVIYIPAIDWYTDGFEIDNYLMSLDLENRDYFCEREGTDAPEYFWVQTDGPDVPLGMPDDPADTPWIYLAGIPYEPCTLTYIVTAEIGSVMAETQVTVQFYECELPQNLGFDRCYTLEKNESRLITADFGEFGPAEADPRISVFCYGNDEGDVVSTDIETTFNEEEEETGFGIRVTGLQPGAVTLPAIASQKGLVWRGDITFIVLNEDGTLPELPELGFSETDTNRANEKPLCPAGDPHFSLDDTVNDLGLANDDFYRNLTGEEPVFTWEQTGGPELELEIRDGALRMVGQIEEPDILTYTVTVSIGEYSASTEMTVRFFARDLPDDTGLASSYTLEIGETVELHALYGGTEWEDGAFHGVFVQDWDFDDVVSVEEIESGEAWEYYLSVTALHPGDTFILVRTNQDGLNWDGFIRFTVLNEDGTMPELPELCFSEYDTNRVNEKPLCPAGDPHFSLDDTVHNLEVINADFYRNLTGEEPVFTWEQTGGPELELEIRDGALRMAGQIAEPDVLTYTVTVSIGEYSASTEMTVRFFARDLPDDIGFASSYTLEIGETVELHALFSGTGWEDGAFHGVFVLDWDFDDVVSVEELESWEAWEYYLSVTGLRPGITYVLVRADQDGLNWDGLIRFTVLNEDGTLPEEPSVENVLVLPGDLLEIDDEAFRGTAAEKIIIPSGCVSIGHLAFAYSSFLRELEIPASVITLENDMLQGCDLSLVIITPENSPAWQWAEAHGIDVRTE